MDTASASHTKAQATASHGEGQSALLPTLVRIILKEKGTPNKLKRERPTGPKGQAKAQGMYLEGEDVLGDLLLALQHFTGLQL